MFARGRLLRKSVFGQERNAENGKRWLRKVVFKVLRNEGTLKKYTQGERLLQLHQARKVTAHSTKTSVHFEATLCLLVQSKAISTIRLSSRRKSLFPSPKEGQIHRRGSQFLCC